MSSTDTALWRSHRLRAACYLTVGVLLVGSLAVVGPGSGASSGPTYTYQAVEVSADNGTLAYDGSPPDDGLHGIACEATYSRLCGLEVEQLDGNVTVRKVNPVERQAPQFVEYFDTYYRRVHQRTGGNITYGLRPVSAETVLTSIARPVEETDNPKRVRRVIQQGTATVERELARGQVVTTSGTSYVLELDAVDRSPERRPATERLALPTLLFGFGLLCLRRGWVQYDRWQASG